MPRSLPQEVSHPITNDDLVHSPPSVFRTLSQNRGAPFADHQVGRVPMSFRGSRDAAAIVVASDATHRVERMVDYRCNGTADDIEIQEAIDYLPS